MAGHSNVALMTEITILTVDETIGKLYAAEMKI